VPEVLAACILSSIFCSFFIIAMRTKKNQLPNEEEKEQERHACMCVEET
jgi:hypothetical protein